MIKPVCGPNDAQKRVLSKSLEPGTSQLNKLPSTSWFIKTIMHVHICEK